MSRDVPAVARWLARALTPAVYRESLLADLDDEFAQHVRAHGLRRARWWYRAQVVQSVLPLARTRWVRRADTSNPMHNESMQSSSLTRGAYRRDLLDDLRFGVRVARGAPLTTAALVSTLIIGIGATTAVFSVANALLLKPLPFADSESVVRLGTSMPSGTTFDYVVYADLIDYRRNLDAYTAVAAFSPEAVTLVRPERASSVRAVRIDFDFQETFTWRAQLGRLLEADDFSRANVPVVVMTDSLWRAEFAADPRIVGRSIVLDGTPTTVVGVLAAADFMYPSSDLGLIRPLYVAATSGAMQRMCHCFEAVAKMKRGADLEATRAVTRAEADRIARAYSSERAHTVPIVTPLRESIVGDARRMVVLLTATVAIVLLIASVNVASLLLGRAESRARELAVRVAIGGTTVRVVRQLLTETLALAFVGGTVGVAISPLLTRALLAAYPLALPRASEVHVDARVLLVAFIVTMAAGLVAALPSVRRVRAVDLAQRLRDGGRAGRSQRAARIGQIIVVSQVALSVALLVVTGLFVTTFRSLSRVDPGFSPAGVYTFSVLTSSARYPSDASVDALFARLDDVVGSTSGIDAVGSTTLLPLSGIFRDDFYRPEIGDRGIENPSPFVSLVSAGYARTMGIAIVRGREFDRGDRPDAARVAYINEALARRHFPGEDPLGRQVVWQGAARTIVGIVKDTRQLSLSEAAEPHLYMPAGQTAPRGRAVVVRTSLSPVALRDVIARALRDLDPTLPTPRVRPLDAIVARAAAPQRFRAALLASLGVIAVLIVAVGIYGTISQRVGQQTREIGIRMALGEAASAVRWRVVIGALRLTVLGAVGGVGVALLVSRWLTTMLVGVAATDPRILGGAVGSLAVVALCAAYAPARRASRVDPVSILRSE